MKACSPLLWRPSREKTIRILLVDDDHHLLRVYARWLGGEGFIIEMAFSGEEAMGAVNLRPPDVVVADVSMPRMNGVELAAVLKVRNIPIILISASPRPETTDPAIPFLRKPFDLPVFAAAIVSLLANNDGR